MPPLPVVPKVLKLVTHFSGGGDNDILNRWYMSYTGTAPTNGDLDAFCADIDTAMNAHIKPLQAASIDYTGSDAEDLSSPTGAVGISGNGYTGSRSGTGPGVATCFVIKKKIARRYRGGHPRLYLVCGTVADFSDINTWGTAFGASVVAGWAAVIADLQAVPWSGGGTLDDVNVSYFEGFTNVTRPSGRMDSVPKLRVGGPVVDPITAYTANLQMGSQRRRNQQ